MLTPSSLSVTAGPLLVRSTVTVLTTTDAIVTVAVAVTAAPLVGVTVSVYVVVAVGLTVTATPLVAPRLPGVIMPVPFAKTPVRAALDPAAMEVGFAVKLVIEGGVVWLLDDPPSQPVNAANPRMRIMASGARTKRRFMSSPVRLR
jgi:hypothetical protein